MSSSLPLAVLLGASAAVWAADQPDPGGPEVSGRAMPEADARPALDAARLVDDEAVVAGGASHLHPARSASQRPLPFVELRLGRTPVFGHSPAAPPPAFGEVGIDIDPRSSVALVPSYRVILDDDDAEGDGSFVAQILRLGVRMRF